MNRKVNGQRHFDAADALPESEARPNDLVAVSFANAISITFRPNFNSLLGHEVLQISSE